jgi:hypothetical protein
VAATLDGHMRQRRRSVTASPDMAIMKASDTITVVEGYDAMRIFLETVWRRHGKTDEEIELLIGGLKWADGAPADPTMWQDWLAAVQIVCAGRSGEVVES